MENELNDSGYQIIEEVFSHEEVKSILNILDHNGLEKKFGVRDFLNKYPELVDKIFTKKLKEVIYSIAPRCDRLIKSIYFDKPPNANWIVNWHQDLTINLKGKKDTKGFKNWRVMTERTVVQPSIEILENIFTVRIHLDDCDKSNGALKIIKGSHQNGVIPIKDWVKKKAGNEHFCKVKKGGILLMKPLTLHSSKRTENKKNRRVIHMEFSDMELPKGLEWIEEIKFKN